MKKEFNKEEAQKARKEELERLSGMLEKGIMDVFTSDNFKQYLRVSAKFHRYSLNNQILIWCQCPSASQVAGFTTWKDIGRSVKKGEKAIKIFAPIKITRKSEEAEITDDAELVPADENRYLLLFKPVSVFDISQTEGKELPSLGVNQLTGKVDGFERFKDAIISISDAPIHFGPVEGESKGYYLPNAHEIMIREGMSELQTVKTMLHELTHSKLHSREAVEERGRVSRDRMETEAEGTAFLVSEYFGLDTAEYSFPYIAGWNGNDAEELRAALETIRVTGNELIESLERELNKKPQNEGEKEA